MSIYTLTKSSDPPNSKALFSTQAEANAVAELVKHYTMGRRGRGRFVSAQAYITKLKGCPWAVHVQFARGKLRPIAYVASVDHRQIEQLISQEDNQQ